MVLEPEIGIVIIQGTVRLCKRAGSAEEKAGKPVPQGKARSVRHLRLTGNPD